MSTSSAYKQTRKYVRVGQFPTFEFSTSNQKGDFNMFKNLYHLNDNARNIRPLHIDAAKFPETSILRRDQPEKADLLVKRDCASSPLELLTSKVFRISKLHSVALT